MIFEGMWARLLRERVFDCFRVIEDMNKNLQVIGEQLTEMNQRLDAIKESKEVQEGKPNEQI